MDQTWCTNYDITKFFDLVHIRILLWISQDIKCGVELIQHLDDLHRSLGVRVKGAVLGKPDDTTEEEGDAIVTFSRNRALVT